MHEQHTIRQLKQKVFATTPHMSHPLPDKGLGCHPQRPTQWFAHTQMQYLRPGNTVREALSGDFNFRQFRHASTGQAEH
jgi:hypothetical protein